MPVSLQRGDDAGFRPIQPGGHAHSQERQTEQLTEHTVLTSQHPEPFSLFIHTDVCLSGERGQLSSYTRRKQKNQRALTETERGLSQNGRSKIESDKHNVVYI